MNTFRFKNIQNEHFTITLGTNGNDIIDIYNYSILPGSNKVEYLTIGKGGEPIRKIINEGEKWEPWLKINAHYGPEMLSNLMDALIDFGIEPKNRKLDTNERTAVEKHLADMRKIVSKKLGVDL